MAFKNMMKKVLSLTLAFGALTASLATFSSCTTNTPEVKMSLSFNGETYEVTYEMDRRVAPATVQHFLELADAEFYNGLCVHDYGASKWFSGGYAYQNETLTERDYDEFVSNLELTQTVWYDAGRTQKTNMVYGEFASNDFSVSNGKFSQTFGSLTMYYTPKEDVDVKVTVKRNDGEGYTKRFYEYNSATSLFYFSTSQSSTTSNDYCTFAKLSEKSVEVFQSLVDAVEEYIADKVESDTEYDFTNDYDETLNVDDRYAEIADVVYNLPKQPIVVESVKVTKW